jgi:deoxyribose-phosphate aldolase
MIKIQLDWCMKLANINIFEMMDLSAVQTNHGDKSMEELAEAANKYGIYLVTTLPSQTPVIMECLGQSSRVKVGGNVGFPSGGNTTSIKVAETKELVKMGVDEIDIVLNIGKLNSDRYSEVLSDLAAVVEAAEDRPVKAIMECFYLSPYRIQRACDISIEAGAAFVKTGTGWTPTGATLENVRLIKSHVGNKIKIKASGGVRDLHTILALYDLGACRFGIGLHRLKHIITQMDFSLNQSPSN